jgi:hypothetical protein
MSMSAVTVVAVALLADDESWIGAGMLGGEPASKLGVEISGAVLIVSSR